MTPDRIFGGDVAYTPAGVVRQHLDFLAELAGPSWSPRRIQCPAAGAGAWVAGARAYWPAARITALEICPEVAPALAAAGADEIVIGDALGHAGDGEFDLIVDNPPWSNFAAWVEALRPRVSATGYLALYGPTQWGQSREAIATLRRHPVLAQGRTGGRVSHHPSGRTDARETCSWVWGPGHAGPAWLTVQLALLPPEARRLPRCAS